MKKASSFTIQAVENGFQLRISDGCHDYSNVFVFETIQNLFTWLLKKFDTDDRVWICER